MSWDWSAHCRPPNPSLVTHIEWIVRTECLLVYGLHGIPVKVSKSLDAPFVLRCYLYFICISYLCICTFIYIYIHIQLAGPIGGWAKATDPKVSKSFVTLIDSIFLTNVSKSLVTLNKGMMFNSCYILFYICVFIYILCTESDDVLPWLVVGHTPMDCRRIPSRVMPVLLCIKKQFLNVFVFLNFFIVFGFFNNVFVYFNA